MGEGGGEKRCLVTGGRGFVARHLVEMLLRSQEWSVRIADLAPSIKLDPDEEGGVLGAALESGRAVYVSTDLRNKAQVLEAFEGVDVLFHMAAPDSSINNYKLHYSVNVEGTKNVIDACVECNVKRLIYTSSPSVVLDPVHGVHDGDESLPYPEKFNDSYSETKAEGEKLVVKANGKNGLLTCCIRPSSIFGPGDRLLVPSLVSAARAGKSKFIIGDGNNLYDFTYVENVAYGHMCAEQALASRETAEKAAGQAYFITNMQSIKFWEFISRIVEGLGYERPRIKVPVYIMMPVAHLVEWIYKIFSRYGMPVPQLIPSRIRLLTCSRTFKCTKAKNQLGYEPIVSLEEGLKKTIEYYSYLRAEQQSRKISKASVYLGNGKVADVLLWKDKKQALTAMFFLAFIYYYLFVSGFTLITALAKLVMIVTMFLFIHGILPEKMFGYKIEKIPPSAFIVPKEVAHQVGSIIGSSWNSAIDVLTSISSGKDWLLFFKVVLALLTISILGTMSLRNLYAIGVPFIFVAFFVYEKWEEEIDGMFEKALTSFQRLRTDLTSKCLWR